MVDDGPQYLSIRCENHVIKCCNLIGLQYFLQQNKFLYRLVTRPPFSIGVRLLPQLPSTYNFMLGGAVVWTASFLVILAKEIFLLWFMQLVVL